jgi:hypothetical protein
MSVKDIPVKAMGNGIVVIFRQKLLNIRDGILFEVIDIRSGRALG